MAEMVYKPPQFFLTIPLGSDEVFEPTDLVVRESVEEESSSRCASF